MVNLFCSFIDAMWRVSSPNCATATTSFKVLDMKLRILALSQQLLHRTPLSADCNFGFIFGEKEQI